MRRLVLAVPMLVAVVGLAGCSDTTAGNATPGEETTESATGERPTLPGGSSEPGEGTSSTEPGSGDNPLAEVRPCDLMPDEGVAQLGLTDEREEQVGKTRACSWRYEGASAAESFSVGVEILEDRGLDDVPGPDVKPVPTIGSHEAVTSPGVTGGCAVSIGVSESSRVDTSAVGGEQQKACQLAMDVAELVEPELP